MKKSIRKRPDSERRLRQHAKLARLLRLLGLLQGHRRLNVRDIAEELQVHERTVHRDLEVLELVGVPWVFDKERKSYRILEHWHNLSIPLTHDDLLDQAAELLRYQVDHRLQGAARAQVAMRLAVSSALFTVSSVESSV